MNARNTKRHGRKICFAIVLLGVLILLTGCAMTSARPQGIVGTATLLDLSGLAWIEDDLFLGVHDTKGGRRRMHCPGSALSAFPDPRPRGSPGNLRS